MEEENRAYRLIDSLAFDESRETPRALLSGFIMQLRMRLHQLYKEEHLNYLVIQMSAKTH